MLIEPGCLDDPFKGHERGHHELHRPILDPTLTLAATRVEEERQMSFWDALLLEAARVAGADRVLPEDLQHGQLIEGVRIENPFMAAIGP